MGSSQSKTAIDAKRRRQPAAPPRKPHPDPRRAPEPPVVKGGQLKPRDYNCFMTAPSFGVRQHIDEDMLEYLGCTKCIMCGDTVSTTRGHYFAIHNTEGCRAVYHEDCMSEYLRKRFTNGRGVAMRPSCFKCHEWMNIKMCKVTRKNPLGFEWFG
ncbi:hypothetical protein PMZ80_005302 [Knufia obscura]|uniref:Uncharacterized protein n=2 Tax=Knufia TaxID=430999 RepID=A0AAN8EKT6_9EURO|nr:hypothetical protein PMZ80_005302 [Knufia obscura]KAK5957969.1 hypothetical protein OHC33_001159 [Knufia fluminis]